MPLFYLVFAVFLAYPVLELVALYQVAQSIGWWLLLWQITSIVLGLSLLREQPMQLAGQVFEAARTGRHPVRGLLTIARFSLAAVLLIIPGVINDAIAVLLVLFPASSQPLPAGRPADDGVIEGEFRREQDVTPPGQRLPGQD